MKNDKEILLKLCDELSKNEVNESKVKQLLKNTDIPYSDNPYELSNQVLKRLHPYQEN